MESNGIDIMSWLLWLGIPLGFALSIIGIGILMNAYPQVRLFFSDITRLFGFAGTWVRKVTVKSEIEGEINAFTKQFNSDVFSHYLPECEVDFVNEKNSRSKIKAGKAIVKVSFSRDDNELNFFSAAYGYVQTGFLHRAKNHIKDNLRKAIDLLFTRILLKNSRRDILSIFNERFSTEPEDTKELYNRLEETEEEGLFKRIFIQELNYFGDLVELSVPKESIKKEVTDFFDWFYELATREKQENTSLKFISEHFKVGVILVASDKTYNKHGIEPYIRRANNYTSEGFNCIYLLSRGVQGKSILNKVTNELLETDCYKQLTKKPDLIRRKGNDEVLVTCMALKPLPLNIEQIAWEKLTEAYSTKTSIEAYITKIFNNRIQVDTYGLKSELTINQLTNKEIKDLDKFFEVDQDIKVIPTNIDQERDIIELTTIGTAYDPEVIIEKISQIEESKITGTVETILKNEETDIEFGLIIDITESDLKAFVHRTNAIASKYADLSSHYSIGDEIELISKNYDYEHSTLNCEVENLRDPWLDFKSKYETGLTYKAIIREITEKYITCELEEGIDGRVYLEEISYEGVEKNKEKINDFHVGEEISVLLKRYNLEKHYCTFSIKRARETEESNFYAKNKDQIIEVTVTYIRHNLAIAKTYNNLDIVIPISEICWWWCSNLNKYLSSGDKINVRLVDYDGYDNRLIASRRNALKHNYEEFAKLYSTGDLVEGEIVKISEKLIGVKIEFDSANKQVYGFIHVSEISNLIYVDEEILERCFQEGDKWEFIVKEIQAENKVIQLSRKLVFEKKYHSGSLQYGETFRGVVLVSGSNSIFYSNELEASLPNNVHESKEEAIIAALGSDSTSISVEMVE